MKISTRSHSTIAYLVNQYPKISHTFIRREIAGLEQCDPSLDVLRFSMRPSEEKLADPLDVVEIERTQVILQQGALKLLAICMLFIIRNPLRFLSACRLTCNVGIGSDRGLWRHGIYLLEAIWLCQRLRRQQVSHVHSHFGTNATTVAMLCHALGGPTYSCTVHGSEEFDRPEQLRLDEKLKRSLFAVAVSWFGRSQLMRWCPHDQWDKLHVIHCGVDKGFLSLSPTPISNSRTLVCVGRLCEQKGQLLLIEAISRLVAERIDVQLRLVGDGPMRPECDAAIERLSLHEHVVITGWASGQQVRDEMQAGRALVLGSFAENLPVVIMEAFAMGRPVVSTYVGGIPELVRPGENGWLIPAGSIEALVEALREVLAADASRLNELGANGRQRVLREHDAAMESAKLYELMKTYLTSPG